MSFFLLDLGSANAGPLHEAAMDGNIDQVKQLVKKADVNARDDGGYTPLHWAADKGHEKVAELLIVQGADVNARDNDRRTPLYPASLLTKTSSFMGDPMFLPDSDMVELLLDHGADVHVEDTDHITPLHWAADQGRQDVAFFLLEKGAEINAKDLEGFTPLITAASEGYDHVAKLLIKKDANLNAQDLDGLTPLHWAVRRGFLPVIKLLIDKGADVHIKDREGLTPIDWAVNKGQKEVVELIERQRTEKQSELEKSKTEALAKAKERYQDFFKKLKADPEATLDMAEIPGGSFTMGAAKYKTEKPPHKVKVDGFKMMTKEITFLQYDMFSELTGRDKPVDEGWGRDNRPVINVAHEDAAAFCQWLGRETGQLFRLPTEAEWEYAARAGTSTEYYWGNEMDGSYAWYRKNAESQTHPVGQRKPNAFGLYDMSGNVREWVADWYDKKYYSKSPEDNPKGPADGTKKVMRGGYWDNKPNMARSAYRLRLPPTLQDPNTGFRCVLASTKP